MPSPNVKKTPEKTLDLGAKLAKRRSQDFKSKIEGWNDTAPAALPSEHLPAQQATTPTKPTTPKTAPAPVKDEREEATGADANAKSRPTTPKAAATPPKPVQKTPGSGRKTSRDVDLERKAWVRKRSKPQVEELPEEVKQATTPKKRVVSDGHWRRDRPKPDPVPPDNDKENAKDAAKEKDVTPRPTVIRRSFVSVGLKVPPSVHDFVERPEVEPWRARQHPRRSASPPRSRSRSRSRDRPNYEDPGLKVYVRRKKVSRPVADHSESSLTGGSSIDRPSVSTEITTPCQSPTKADLRRPTTAPRERRTKSSPFDDNLRLSSDSRKKSMGQVQDTDFSRRPKTAEALTKKPLGRHASADAVPVPPPVPNGRIEGWLAGMSDPFVEPSKRSADRERGSQDDARAERPSRNLEPVETTRRCGERRSRSRIDSDLSATSTPTLKRSGARRDAHSPVKSRYVSQSGDVRGPRRAVTENHPRDLGSSGRDREFVPNTRDRLSNIMSNETRGPHRRPPSEGSERPTLSIEGSLVSGVSEGNQPQLQRRLTKHSDLMSVLSLPRGERDGRIRPARSTRSRSLRRDGNNLAQVMNEVTADELKYQRELRTLVDGVIPVLLTYVLQKHDPSGSKRLFSGSSKDGTAITRPIVEMGVALERLKALHKRVPLHQPADLVQWAAGAAKTYDDYLNVWRLDFEDIVVNLAPAEELPSKDSSWDADLPRNKKGELENGNGERANVAYLLKRPLTRLKALSRALTAIRDAKLSDDATADVSIKFMDLTNKARQRANDERARIEDEAASSIDPTKARDPRSLEPLGGVMIDPTKTVRARDYFDLDLVHSSGQQIDCKVELIVRDAAAGRGVSGDILFCQISDQGRWLLFPPIPLAFVSARNGEADGELVVMVRGMTAGEREWREVMSFRTADHGAVDEWRDMLGTSPLPSRLSKKSSFNLPRAPSRKDLTLRIEDNRDSRKLPALKEDDVPFGEPAKAESRIWDASEVASIFSDDTAQSPSKFGAPRPRGAPVSPTGSVDSYERIHARHYSARDRAEAHRSRFGHDERHDPGRMLSRDELKLRPRHSKSRNDYNVWIPASELGSDLSSGEDEYDDYSEHHGQRPPMHRRKSSVPSTELPSIPKIRPPQAGAETPKRELAHTRSESTPMLPRNTMEPTSAPAKLQKPAPQEEPQNREADQETPLAAKRSSTGFRASIIPALTPAFLKKHRRSSSPLKHEYEPENDSDTGSVHDQSDDYDDDLESITSESSVELAEEGVSVIGDLRGFQQYTNRQYNQPSPKRLSPPIEEPSGETLGPSDSASQGPYRGVPNGNKYAKTVACLFTWADKGTWDSMHPEECCIIVSPGLIEAFDLAQAGAVATADGEELVSPSQKGVKPLVALELTPLVPLRRGTAVDISVRSPPTANSVLRMGNNIMFRSRSPEECEHLYTLINRARIDNPTYIALQNARGPVPTSNWGEIMDRNNAARTAPTSSSWWNFGSRKGSTYRSKGTRSASTVATESSVGTMNSAMSALRRFGGTNRIFNIAKSTLTSREGTRSTNSDSLSSGVATPPQFDPRLGTPMGITNVKIRLYMRESASKWIDLGAARLTVMLPPRDDPAIISNPKANGTEKRVFVVGKKKDQVLLDVVLGESCFERIARTGIAVSVYEESEHIGALGGVNSAKTRVFMLQMKSERDAAYTFTLVGKLRY